MSQLKKLSKRKTRNQLGYRKIKIYRRENSLQGKQEKDRFPNMRMKLEDING